MSSKRNHSHSFWTSKHKWDYCIIGLRYFTSPFRVYKLAHGKAEAHEHEHKIMHALKLKHIVHSRSQQNNG